MKYKKYILDSFKKLDTGEQSDFFNMLPEDTQWTLNQTHISIGKNSVKNELQKFYSGIMNSNHTFLNVWETDDTYIITADLSLTTFTNELKDFSWTAIVNITDGSMVKVEMFTDSFFEE